jgi:hypothetical protein
MMKYKLFLILLCSQIAFAGAQVLQSSLLSAAGDSYKNSTAQVEWTLGEIAVETYENNGFLTQGFLQGSPVLLIGLVDKFTSVNHYGITVYPNPFTNKFQLSFLNPPNGQVSVQVNDLLGKLVYQMKDMNVDYQYNMTGYASGMYIISVMSENINLGTFKVTKQ